MENKEYTLDNLYSDLNIDGEEYAEFRRMCYDDCVKAVERINRFSFMDLIPVFESDLQREQDYLDECNEKMFIVFNINGIVLYRKEKVLDDKYIQVGQKFMGRTDGRVFFITAIARKGERLSVHNAPVEYDTVQIVDMNNRYSTMGLDNFKRLLIIPVEEHDGDGIDISHGSIEIECPYCHEKTKVQITLYADHLWFSWGCCEVCEKSLVVYKDIEDVGKPMQTIKKKYLDRLRSLC